MPSAKTKEQEIFISVPKFHLGRAVISIEGTSPLVTNPFPAGAVEEIEYKETTPIPEQPKKKEYKVKKPWEHFANATYWITEVPRPQITSEEEWLALWKGKNKPKFGFQVSGIKESALTAVMRLGLVKNLPTARTYFNIINTHTDTLYGQSVVEILSKHPPVMRRDCLSTFNAGASMRYRMMFEQWSMDLEIEFLSDFINIENIMSWFQYGGRGVGLGENRPEKGGPWGSYQVKAG